MLQLPIIPEYKNISRITKLWRFTRSADYVRTLYILIYFFLITTLLMSHVLTIVHTLCDLTDSPAVAGSLLALHVTNIHCVAFGFSACPRALVCRPYGAKKERKSQWKMAYTCINGLVHKSNSTCSALCLHSMCPALPCHTYCYRYGSLASRHGYFVRSHFSIRCLDYCGILQKCSYSDKFVTVVWYRFRAKYTSTHTHTHAYESAHVVRPSLQNHTFHEQSCPPDSSCRMQTNMQKRSF